jgi:hypothetical protein
MRVSGLGIQLVHRLRFCAGRFAPPAAGIPRPLLAVATCVNENPAGDLLADEALAGAVDATGVRAMAAGAEPIFCELNENRCGGAGAGGPILVTLMLALAMETAVAAWLPVPAKPIEETPPTPTPAAAAAAAFLDFFNSLARCSSNSAGEAAAALLATAGVWRMGRDGADDGADCAPPVPARGADSVRARAPALESSH